MGEITRFVIGGIVILFPHSRHIYYNTLGS